MPRVRQLRRTFSVTLALFIGGMLAVSGYALWRLQAEVLANGLEISAMHARGVEDFLTQSLRVTELLAVNALPLDTGAADPGRLARSFGAALRQAPFLRSISLQDARGRIVASSNPANLGLVVATHDYLPRAADPREMLRIGQPWAGRDLAGGRPSSAAQPVEPDSASFIPVTRALGHGATLLLALNPDYFIGHITQALDPSEGTVAVLRYDGTLLMSSDPGAPPGIARAALIAQMRLPEIESGRFEREAGPGRRELSAFHASQLYPFVVLAGRDRARALAPWRAEARIVLVLLLLALLVIGLIAAALYRRQAQLVAQRADAERRLADSERLSRTVADNLPGLVAYWDRDLRCRFSNERYVEWFGKTPRDMLGMHMADLLGPALFARNEPFVQLALRGVPQSFERSLTKPSGEISHMWANYIPDRDASGQVAGLFVLVSDVTLLKRSEEAQRIAATAFESHEAMAITDAAGVILRVNQAFTGITGYAAEDIVGRTPAVLKSGRHDAAFYAAMWQSIAQRGSWQGEVWDRRQSGQIYPNWLTITAVKDGHGAVTHYVATQTDISARKAAEEEIHRLAFFDALTGLPNRRLLMARLEQTLAGAARRAGALMFIDLDKFKILNDTRGHDMGDLLLQQVAARLSACVGPAGTVARLGGDEFVVLLASPDESAEAAAAALGRRILAALGAPYDLAGQAHHSTPSIGVALFGQAGDSVTELLKRADSAMYQAKAAGRNGLCFFGAAQFHRSAARPAIDTVID